MTISQPRLAGCPRPPSGKPLRQILGIGGSPRKNGNSDVLLDQVAAGSRSLSLPITCLHLRDLRFQGCIGCEQCRRDRICTGLLDGMSLLYPDLDAARGLILVSPTHNYNITSWMKAFIDRLYCFYTFEDTIPRNWSSNLANQHRKAVIVAVCEQENEADMGFTLAAMRQPLTALGYDIVGELPVFRVFHRGRVKKQEETMETAYQLGITLAESI